MRPASVEFLTYDESVAAALDAIGAAEKLAGQSAVLVKPNLVNTSPHPVTTPPEACAAVVRYVRRHSRAEVIIAEGCGDAHRETAEIFSALGYDKMTQDLGVKLHDLNHGSVRKLDTPDGLVFKEMFIPEIAFSHYIISVPVLKAHSLAIVTGTLKNMMGFMQPRYYHNPSVGVWKKSVFHRQMQESLIDLNRCLVPDLTVMDATVGLAEHHLGGAHCNPPVNRILAGYDPWEFDAEAARMLGKDPLDVRHIAQGIK